MSEQCGSARWQGRRQAGEGPRAGRPTAHAGEDETGRAAGEAARVGRALLGQLRIRAPPPPPTGGSQRGPRCAAEGVGCVVCPGGAPRWPGQAGSSRGRCGPPFSLLHRAPGLPRGLREQAGGAGRGRGRPGHMCSACVRAPARPWRSSALPSLRPAAAPLRGLRHGT